MEMDKFCYVAFLAGVCFWQYPSVYWVLCMCKTRVHLSRNLGRLTDEEDLRRHGRVAKHVRLLIEGADAKKVFPTVRGFFWLCVLLLAGGTVILSMVLPLGTAFLSGLFLAMLPYVFLQVRLHEKRVERSKEGDILVQELLNYYQIYDYNMQEAIEQTALHLDAAPLGKRLYLELAKGLQHAVTKKEVEDVLLSFRYAFHTAWGNVLASNIFFAHLYGIKVDASLKDLLYCMIQSRKAIEYGRRENHEAKLMLLYLAPISFLLSVFFACRYFDFTIKKFIAYQFGTALGMQWFLAMVFCYVVSLLIQKFLAKEKMDL